MPKVARVPATSPLSQHLHLLDQGALLPSSLVLPSGNPGFPRAGQRL